MTTISVIIPCKGDSEPLADLLARLGGRPEIDVTVVTPATDTAVDKLCARVSASHVVLPGLSRGARLRNAALKTKGDILWFLHADSLITGELITRIQASIADGSSGGYCRFRFRPRPNPFARITEWGVDFRCAIGGTPYGDQGLFFTRGLYQACGGHQDLPLFEEVSLVKKARRLGGFQALDAAIGIDPRRWIQDGFVRRTVRNRVIAILYGLGVSPQRLTKLYQINRK